MCIRDSSCPDRQASWRAYRTPPGAPRPQVLPSGAPSVRLIMHNLSPLPYPTAYHETVLPFRRLLVALSGRDTDCGLLRYAAMLKGILSGAEILCLHVAGDGD